ncbi:hotdog family protein [Flaviaesturariibacter terrae]
MSSEAAFQKLVHSKTRFRLFLLAKLPAAWFAGLRLRNCTATECVVDVPYRWFTKNPFRSTYFACLAMGAELSTGALCMQYIYGRRPPVSMLVTAMEARFFKKATGSTRFTCSDGAAIAAAIDAAIATGEGQTVNARSIGRNGAGEVVAEFTFTWSFKSKKAATI